MELDEHHMLWCLNSLDSAACAVRWAMWQEKYAALGMDVKVTICSWNTKEIIGFGHGCNGNRMPLEHEGNYGFGHGCNHNLLRAAKAYGP